MASTNIQGTLDPNSHDFGLSVTFTFPGPNATIISVPFNLQLVGHRYDALVTYLGTMLNPTQRVNGPASAVGVGDVARHLSKVYEIMNTPAPAPALQAFTAPDVS